MIPYGRQDIRPEDIEAVIETLKSDYLTQGPKVPEFEAAVAKAADAAHCVAANSATSALHIACRALDLGPDDLMWSFMVFNSRGSLDFEQIFFARLTSERIQAVLCFHGLKESARVYWPVKVSLR